MSSLHIGPRLTILDDYSRVCDGLASIPHWLTLDKRINTT
jgi:hypothetical protein